MTKEVMKLALNALNESGLRWPTIVEAIKALEEALKQEQGEPNNSEYERGFIDGMQKQMQSSVDKAVRNMKNKLTQEWEVLQSIKRHTITTQDEIQTAILRVCKVANHDSDFNVVGFHSLCDKLIKLGEEKERINAKQEQDEPVGWLDSNDIHAEFMHKDLKVEHDKRGSFTPRMFQIPVYTTPHQRTWIGLLHDEKEHIEISGGKADLTLAEKIEAILKERNT